MSWEAYKIARSVAEALSCLQGCRGKARVIAGGTDLVVQERERDSEDAQVLVDVGSVAEMRGVEVTEGGKWILVGAATTMAELARSDIIATYGTALARGASCMGAPQIRNVATIGGNVVNAQPAADGTIPLLALGAEAKIVSAAGEEWMPLGELFLDVGKSLVDPTGQIITHFRFQAAGAQMASSFQRLAKRKAFTLPTLVVAAHVKLDNEKRFQCVRIAAGPVAKTPWRAKAAEQSLLGGSATREIVERAAALAKSDACPRDSLRGGAEYRKGMVEVLTRRALTECLSALGVWIDE